MIRIDSDIYDMDIHNVSEEEAGILLEHALDLMEGRDPNNRTAELPIRATEVVPEPFLDDEDEEIYPFFTGCEWSLISKVTHVLRVHGIVPDLKVRAYMYPLKQERGIKVSCGSGDSEMIPLDRGCGNLHILKVLVDMADRWCEEP